MTDQDVIRKSYEDSLSRVYAAFDNAFTAALGDPQKEAEAGVRFQRGVVHVRHIRDRALELLRQVPGEAAESRPPRAASPRAAAKPAGGRKTPEPG